MENRFSPDDLNQISRESLTRLNKSDLILLTLRLRDFGIEMFEKLNQDSSNSSRPPSSDDPYKKKDKADSPKESKTEDQDKEGPPKESKTGDQDKDGDKTAVDSKPVEAQCDPTDSENGQKRSAGRQPGSQGFWRSQKPEAKFTKDHHPQQCIICGKKLAPQVSPHTGYYTYEL